MTDEEISEAYTIYNIYAYLTYKKGNKKPNILIQIVKDFDAAKNPIYNRVYLKLPDQIEAHFRSWGRASAKVVSDYLLERDTYYLGKIRFDLIADETKENFCIPNLPLESICFYDNRVSANNSHNIVIL